MDDRLASCFRAVVSEEDWARILEAPDRPIEELDSVQWVTIFALLEEEFGKPIDYEELDSVLSLESLRTLVERSES